MEKKFIRPSEKDKKKSDEIRRDKEKSKDRPEGKLMKKVVKKTFTGTGGEKDKLSSVSGKKVEGKEKIQTSMESRSDRISGSPENKKERMEDSKTVRKKIIRKIRTASGEIITREEYVTEERKPEKKAEERNPEKKAEIKEEENLKSPVSPTIHPFKKKEQANPEEEISIKEWFSKKATEIKPIKKIEDKPEEIKTKETEIKERVTKKIEDKPEEIKTKETEIKERVTKKIEDKPLLSVKKTEPFGEKISSDFLSPSSATDIHYLDRCLKKIIELGASDLHLSIGHSPMIRCRGDLQNVDLPVFSKEIAEMVLNKILTDLDRKELEEKFNLDFAYIMETDGPPVRFRSNAYYHRSGLNIIMRVIPNRIPQLKELGMPDIVGAFGRFKQGLILVTGSSGSGKTSTLTALIDLINTERNAHIITIEDPIEFIHKPKKCIVRQRQVGVHTKNYNRALKASMRENPDIILVSELRDLETIQLAMTAAETGCLVLSTMNTTSAARTIDRIIDSFPPDQRIQSGAMLSDSLRGILSQQLISSIDRSVRYAAVEVLVGCTPLASLIREQKTYQINSLIETSKGLGMQSMDSSLLELLKNNLISPEVAYEAALDKSIFNEQVKGKI